VLIGEQFAIPDNFLRLPIVAEALWWFRKRFSRCYAHYQEPPNSYNTLSPPRHAPLICAGLSLALKAVMLTATGDIIDCIEERANVLPEKKPPPCRLGLGPQTHGMQPTFTYGLPSPALWD